jgi:hypothetical protein
MSEIISGIPEHEIKQIDFRSNEKKYKEVFANGRKNRWLNKYSNTEHAYKSRDILIKIATKERELLKDGTLKSIGDSVAIYPIMLSRAAGGLLSDKSMPEYNGESPRDFVLHTLEKYYQEEYQIENNREN